MPPAFALGHFDDRLGPIQIQKALLQRRDRVQKITAPRCETPGENRVGGVGSVKYSGPFLRR